MADIGLGISWDSNIGQTGATFVPSVTQVQFVVNLIALGK